MAERFAQIEDESALEYAEPIRRAGQRLLDTNIGAVLDLSRIESGALELQPALINLVALLERQVKELGVLARKKGVVLLCQSTSLTRLYSSTNIAFPTRSSSRSRTR
jgi:signal transduction histidine kinase